MATDPTQGPTSDADERARPAHLQPPEPPRADPTGMSLAELRGYRRLLAGEEDRVSYWRRVVQARLDILDGQSGGGSSAPLSLDQLARALGDTATGRSRQALARLDAAEPLPAFPALERFWTQAPGGGRHRDELREVEGELTAYRRALHERLDAITRHLVDRYREDPRAALELLPHR